MAEHLSLQVDNDGIATITLNVPDRPMNVVGPQMMSDLSAALDKIEHDDNIKGAIITSGKQDFMAGADLKWLCETLDQDLDIKQGTVRVLHGKGDRARVVGLDEGACAILQRWLDRRQQLRINGRRRVFCTLDGKPLQPSYVRALLPRVARKAGIEKRVHAHGLRHTHAFELANEGHALHVIQAQLGHSSLATTDRYIRHLAPQEVVNVMRSRQWSL